MYLYFAEWKDGSRAWVMAKNDTDCYEELMQEKNPWEADVYKFGGTVMLMEKVDEFQNVEPIISNREKWVRRFWDKPDDQEGGE